MESENEIHSKFLLSRIKGYVKGQEGDFALFFDKLNDVLYKLVFYW